MIVDFKAYLIVCPLVFLAGFVDAIGGGGGLISLPAYIFAGLPAPIAAATNKLSACVGTIASTTRYVKNKCYDIGLAIPAIIAALIGANIGANIALSISENTFKLIMLAVLPIIAIYVIFKKDLEPKGAAPKRSVQMLISCIFSLIIGTYDGIYGPGTGTFLILIYTSLAKIDVRTAGGNTKLVNLASNVASLVVFLLNGRVLLPLGLTASVFSVFGHYLGAGAAIKNGSKYVRFIIIIVIVLLVIKLLSELI